MQPPEDKTGTRAVGAGETWHGRSWIAAPPPKRLTRVTRELRLAARDAEGRDYLILIRG